MGRTMQRKVLFTGCLFLSLFLIGYRVIQLGTQTNTTVEKAGPVNLPINFEVFTISEDGDFRQFKNVNMIELYDAHNGRVTLSDGLQINITGDDIEIVPVE